MACPTCDHAMGAILEHRIIPNIYLCPRCGTVVEEDGEVYVPMLVERCRNFAGFEMPDLMERRWEQLGIAESIELPENR